MKARYYINVTPIAFVQLKDKAIGYMEKDEITAFVTQK